MCESESVCGVCVCVCVERVCVRVMKMMVVMMMCVSRVDPAVLRLPDQGSITAAGHRSVHE